MFTKQLCSVVFVVLALALMSRSIGAQFWKLNMRNDNELFMLETKANIASGICYKQEPRASVNPDLRLKTVSYCCDGYRRTSPSGSLQCEPICTEDCSNGICTSPDVCECYPGYTRLGGRCEEF